MTVVFCLMLAGCEYTVPLVDNADIEIDRSVVGLWQRPTKNGQLESLLVLPLNNYEYMVSYPAGSKDAMFARGCLWCGADMRLVQLDWFGNAQGETADNSRTFQFAAYAVNGDQVSIQILNADVVKTDIESAEALVKSITVNRENPNLFKEAMVFTKVQN